METEQLLTSGHVLSFNSHLYIFFFLSFFLLQGMLVTFAQFYINKLAASFCPKEEDEFDPKRGKSFWQDVHKTPKCLEIKNNVLK